MNEVETNLVDIKHTFHAPRALIKWLEKFNLTYKITNFARDLSNGYLVAEILCRKMKKVDINYFYNEQSLEKKFHNWEKIRFLLDLLKVENDQQMVNDIIFMQKDAALIFLIKLHKAMTHKEITWNFPAKVEFPNYHSRTINFLMKNRKIHNIEANHVRLEMQKNIIEKHKEEYKERKKKLGLQRYIEDKKKTIIKKELDKFKLKKHKINAFEKKTLETETLYLQNYKKVEKINSNNLCLTDRRQGFLEAVGELVKKNIKHFTDKENNFYYEEKNFEEMCEEPKNFDFEFIELVFHVLSENAKELVEKLNGNLSNLLILFEALLKFIYKIPNEKRYVRLFEEFFKNFGNHLQNENGDVILIFLENTSFRLIREFIKRTRDKHNFMAIIIHHMCPIEANERCKLICKLKEVFGSDLKNFIELLSRISVYYVEDNDLVYFNTMLYYCLICIKYPSIKMMKASLKIFYEICDINFYKIMYELMELSVDRLLDTNYWEIDTLFLLICCKIVKYIDNVENEKKETKNDLKIKEFEYGEDEKSNLSISCENVDSIDPYQLNSVADKEAVNERNRRFFLEYIFKIFTKNENKNMIKISLIYIAPILSNYEELTEHYFKVLISLDLKTLKKILVEEDLQSPTKAVLGLNSYEYFQTGAHLSWNSLGIIKALIKELNNKTVKILDDKYCFLIYSCLKQQILEENYSQWLTVFDQLEIFIINTFQDSENCIQALEILKNFLSYEFITNNFLEKSFTNFYNCLETLYRTDMTEENDSCVKNFYDLLCFLVKLNEFKNFIFEVLKSFSENNFYVFKESNLCVLMNELAREKRDMIFGDRYLENLLAS